ncbi:hypothetical protein ABEB36_009609 [Hypothenemus hampei]|uniref:Transmembrane protein n=1 Tax=Hypothenemus hampei TaxID=57062 RepID=A0ABD1EGW4_HYPHA
MHLQKTSGFKYSLTARSRISILQRQSISLVSLVVPSNPTPVEVPRSPTPVVVPCSPTPVIAPKINITSKMAAKIAVANTPLYRALVHVICFIFCYLRRYEKMEMAITKNDLLGVFVFGVLAVFGVLSVLIMSLCKKRTSFSEFDDLVVLREVLAHNLFENPDLWLVIQENVASVTGKSFVLKTLKDHLYRLIKLWFDQSKMLRDK